MRAHRIILALTVETTLVTGLYSNSFGVPGVNTTYDYVGIGGGTAGLKLAARLARLANDRHCNRSWWFLSTRQWQWKRYTRPVHNTVHRLRPKRYPISGRLEIRNDTTSWESRAEEQTVLMAKY